MATLSLKASSFTNISSANFNGTNRSSFKVSQSRVVMSATKDAPKKGSKSPSKETLLTPRFYTTDFDEMEKVLTVNLPRIELV